MTRRRGLGSRWMFSVSVQNGLLFESLPPDVSRSRCAALPLPLRLKDAHFVRSSTAAFSFSHTTFASPRSMCVFDL